MERALSALQQAYLLGRSDHVPLGGVAMQEFREYRGRVDVAALRARLLAVVRRHDCLRLRIHPERLAQSVSPEPVLNLEEVDLRACVRADALQHIDDLREEFAHRHCDFERALWEVVVFLLPEDDGEDSEVLFLRFDAQCVDGRSIASLVVELFGDGDASLPTPSQAASTAAMTPARRQDAAYWAQKLRAVSGPPRLPWTRPLETIKVARYERQSLMVKRARFAMLSRAGAKLHLFANSTLTSVVMDVVSRWVDEGSLCVAVPVAPPAEGALANRSSFIAIHWDASQGNFVERARSLQTDVLEGLEHLSFSGVDITRVLVNANQGWPALPVVITSGISWPNLGKDSPVRLHTGLVQTPQVAIDFRFSVDPHGDLSIDVDYAREAIDRAIVADMLRAIDRAIDKLCVTFNLDARDFVDTSHYRHNGLAHERDSFLSRIADHLFDGRTRKDALRCGDQRISYVKLGEQVARTMAALRAQGIGPGSVVAVVLPRSPQHTVTVLACALLGAVWVPIDAQLPANRIETMVQTCRPQLVVSRDTWLSADLPVEPRALCAPLETLSDSDQPAYFLFTSGTTGKPKCVVLSNRATANVIARTTDAWDVSEHDVFLSVTPIHHDMSVFDVLGCLAAGATLVMPAADEEKDAIRWNQLVRDHGVTLWCSVPAILEMLLACRRGEELASLRLVAQGGDYIKPAVIAELRRLLPQARLISLGGPTETTIWSIWHELGPDDTGTVPYGRPLPGNHYFVLNERGEHCPVGVVGRMHTAGVNVALGYLEDGVLTQHDFGTIADAAGQPVRAYRGNDSGRYLADGTLMFAGRFEGYVKVRGVRVSLADIESELARHPAIRQVLAVDFGSEQQGETAIGVLYVATSPVELREFAKLHLPASHVPTRLVAVAELPLSANGKPDRRRARELLRGPSADNVLLAIYLSVLGKTEADDKTELLTLGLLPSHLKSIAVRIQQQLHITLTPPQLARCRNVEQVKQLISSLPPAARG